MEIFTVQTLQDRLEIRMIDQLRIFSLSLGLCVMHTILKCAMLATAGMMARICKLEVECVAKFALFEERPEWKCCETC